MADQPTEARLALYRKLSTEHLQTLLRSDLDGPPLDEATVDSILTVLAERRRTPADTSAAWQDFSAYYTTPKQLLSGGYATLLLFARTCRRPTPASASRSAWCPPLRPCLS